MTLDDGTVITTLSSAEESRIAHESPHIIACCEAGKVSEEAFYRMRSRVSYSVAKGGGLLFMTGTFEQSRSWYRTYWNLWQAAGSDRQSYALSTTTNHHVYPLGENDPAYLALVEDTPEEYIQERIHGIPRMPSGLVFGSDFSPEHHIRDVEFDPAFPVASIAVDPGMEAVHAVLAIQDGNPIKVFWEFYERRYTTGEVIARCQTEPWWDYVRDGAIDLQATRNQQAVDEIPIQTWRNRTGLNLQSNYVKIQDGIDRLKQFLRLDPVTGAPRIVFSPRCRGILSEFGIAESPITNRFQAYSYKEDRDGNSSGLPTPRHDHAIKALTYWLVAKYGGVDAPRRNPKGGKKRWSVARRSR